jgi:hypothetical protein
VSFEQLGETHGVFLLCHGCYSWPSSPLPVPGEINSPLWVQLSVPRPRMHAGKLKEEGKRRLLGFNGLNRCPIYYLSGPSHIFVTATARSGLPQLAGEVYHRGAPCNHIRHQNRFRNVISLSIQLSDAKGFYSNRTRRLR